MWNPVMQETKYWPRAIILVDMNAFFASIEQLDHPEWRGKPLAVTNGLQGTCIITCSYEARRFGVKTGMRLYEARRLCPQLIQAGTRPKRYTEVSTRIMEALATITPDIEVFSIDEAFLDVTRCQLLHGSPERMARMAQERVFEASGLPCSVGLSGDKTTAKYAAEIQKPNGFQIIPPWEAKEKLRHVPVTALCGIGKGVAAFLASHGVSLCGDMEKVPISVMAKRFGNLGRRMWYMCQGMDPEPVHTEIADPKSMGHGKVLPPNTNQKNTIEIYLMHMCEKLAARLRCHGYKAQHFFIGFKNREFGWLGQTVGLMQPTDDGREIFQLGQAVMESWWHGEPVFQVQVTAVDPQSHGLQLDFFCEPDAKRQQLNWIRDQINTRYGAFAIAPAPLLLRSSMPNVIAPAWKPDGHRQSV